jgi:hypothetical protein
MEERKLPDPRVYIGLPFYDRVYPQTMLAATAYASDVPGRCAVPQIMGSGFHCANFNALWAAALNTRKEVGWTHLAMIHSDVHPTMFWVDLLLAEMAKTGADVLCVVLPIKDDKRITSIGVLNKDTLCTRRLTMKEINNYLPPTFASEDLKALGHKNHLLMPVAGLFVCDFTKPWIEKVWFEAPSRIIQQPDGTFISAVWDEGWNLSLQMHQLGLKILATQVVPARHLGGGEWDNQTDDGGWETDGGDTSQAWILGRTP